MNTRYSLLGSIVVASLTVASPVFAGPPLLCFPFETGGAKTLPMKGGDWKSVDPKYDVSHLTADTLALLAPANPVVARMETIRRATIYASTHPQVAADLLAALQARAAAKTETAPSSVFDFGYLVETYKQATFMFSSPVKGLGEIDGYQLVLKASAVPDCVIGETSGIAPRLGWSTWLKTREFTRDADDCVLTGAATMRGALAA